MGAAIDRRVSVKSPSGLFTIDLPEGAPTVNDIHPWNWAQLLSRIEKANEIGTQNTSVSERQVMAVKVLDEVLSFLWTVNWRSLDLINLSQALKDIRDGHEHPLLQPQRTSRPKESVRLRSIKEWSAAAMQILMENGYKKFDAAKTIERVLGESGFRLTRGGRRATAKTVAAWRDRYIGRGSKDAANGFRAALAIIECKGRMDAHLRTNDPKVKVQRALSLVRRSTGNLI